MRRNHSEREPRDGYARLFATRSNQELLAILGWSYNGFTRDAVSWPAAMSGNNNRIGRWKKVVCWETKPDQMLARNFGHPVSAVRHRRWKKRIRLNLKPEHDRILVTQTDHQAALLLGRSQTNVAWHRNGAGIPTKAKARPWTPEEDASIVAHLRDVKGIQAWHDSCDS